MKQQSENPGARNAAGHRTLRFSLRWAFVVMTTVCLSLCFARVTAPHMALLYFGLMAVLSSAILIVEKFRQQTSRLVRMASILFAVVSWLSLYVLSIGPVALESDQSHSFEAKLRKVYAPVFWLHDNTPLRTPLDWWADKWWGTRDRFK